MITSLNRRAYLTWLGMLAAGSVLAPVAPAHAQERPASDFPNRPIRVIVPLSSGSGGDGYARLFSEKLNGLLGQPVIIENLPGAGGTVAAAAFKRAPADGYTFLLATAGLISGNPLFVRNLPYNPATDFVPVAGVARGMNVFIVPSASPIRSLADLVVHAKHAKALLNCGTVSPLYQVSQQWFAKLAGINFSNVPYKASGGLVADIAGEQLELAVTDLASAAPLMRAGKVRALAVTGATRHPEFPNLPTVMESGWPDYVNYAWVAFYARSETPSAVIKKFGNAVLSVQQSAEAKELATRFGGELMPMNSVELRTFQQGEFERFRAVAKSSGIEPQ